MLGNQQPHRPDGHADTADFENLPPRAHTAGIRPLELRWHGGVAILWTQLRVHSSCYGHRALDGPGKTIYLSQGEHATRIPLLAHLKLLSLPQHITYNVVRKTINGLIFIATIITFLPFIGFGTYFDEEKRECRRYRDAETLWDKSYAVLFMAFGKFGTNLQLKSHELNDPMQVPSFAWSLSCATCL